MFDSVGRRSRAKKRSMSCRLIGHSQRDSVGTAAGASLAAVCFSIGVGNAAADVLSDGAAGGGFVVFS
jgi:hypothetical protein